MLLLLLYSLLLLSHSSKRTYQSVVESSQCCCSCHLERRKWCSRILRKSASLRGHLHITFLMAADPCCQDMNRVFLHFHRCLLGNISFLKDIGALPQMRREKNIPIVQIFSFEFLSYQKGAIPSRKGSLPGKQGNAKLLFMPSQE